MKEKQLIVNQFIRYVITTRPTVRNVFEFRANQLGARRVYKVTQQKEWDGRRKRGTTFDRLSNPIMTRSRQYTSIRTLGQIEIGIIQSGMCLYAFFFFHYSFAFCGRHFLLFAVKKYRTT